MIIAPDLASLPCRTVEKCLDLGPFSVSMLTVANVDDLLVGVDLSSAAPPYWAELWAASVGLATHICREPDLDGKRVLEIGCGLGLAGIAAARAGAEVLLTDVDPQAVTFAAHNARRNGCGNVRVMRMSWHFPTLEGAFDRILGSDVIYDPDHFGAIARLIEQALAPGGRAVLAEPQRDIARDFYDTMRAQGYACIRFVRDVELGGHTHRIGIAELSRR